MPRLSRRCPYCGAENQPNVTFCRSCGRRFAANQRQQISHHQQKNAPLHRKGISDTSSRHFVTPNQQQQVPRQQQRQVPSQGKKVYNIRRRTSMNWRSPRFLLTMLIIFIGLVTGVVLVFVYVHSVTYSDITGGIPPLPTPVSARTTYINTQYGYTFQYPTQWHITSSSDNSLVRVFLKYDVSVPEAEAFEINCFSNPTQQNAQATWQQTKPPESNETEVGPVTFSSGVSAYEANGQGQTPYTLYTLVNNQVACQALVPQTDALNAQVVLTTLNSFSWQ